MSEQQRGVNWRAWIVGLLIALVAIVALQNTEEVRIQVLFVETTAPLIAALLLAVAAGAVIGYVGPLVRRHRRAGRDPEG